MPLDPQRAVATERTQFTLEYCVDCEETPDLECMERNQCMFASSVGAATAQG